MKVYISGKIGEEVVSEATRQKFEAAEEMLQSMGHEVFNPASEAWQRVLRYDYLEEKKRRNPYLEGDFPDFYTYAILRDNMIIATKDAIFMLPDWINSPGAKAELAFAKATKKKILWQNKFDAINYLKDKWWDEEYVDCQGWNMKSIICKSMIPALRKKPRKKCEILVFNYQEIQQKLIF